jgi:hypothetical protein
MHPEVNLHIMESNKTAVEEALFNASADFGLYFTQNMSHPILDTLVLSQSELVYCFASDKAVVSSDALPEHFPVTAPVMLASFGSTLRAEQDRLFTSVSDQPLNIVCEAQPDILNRLAGQEAADTILPVDMLSPDARSRSRSFQTPQPYYLVLVHHPALPLPLSSGDLIRLLCDTFSSYFNHS